MPYYRKNLYILSIAIFLTCLSWNQVIPFLPLFMKQMGVERGQLLGWVGVVFSLQSAASMITMPIWGKLGDKYGRKTMAIRAGLFLSAIYFGTSLCTTPWQVAILRFLNGALTGFIPSSMALIATNTPDELAPRSIATAQMASAAGLIIGPLIGISLATLAGYRGSMQISGIAVLLSTLMVWWLVEERTKAEVVEETSLLHDFSTSIRSKVLTTVMLTVMLSGIFIAAINPILALHVSKLNGRAPSWLTGFVFSLLPAALVLTAQRWTHFGERYGYGRAIHIGLVGAAVCAGVLTFVSNAWVFSAIFFLAGVFLAALSPCTGAVICTLVREDFRGRAYGMQSSASMLGTLIAPLAATRIGDLYGLHAVFAFVGVVTILGSAALPSLVRGWAHDAYETEAVKEALVES